MSYYLIPWILVASNEDNQRKASENIIEAFKFNVIGCLAFLSGISSIR